MPASASRKSRGAKTQALVAEWYQRLWPGATSAGSGAPGRDILNVPLDIEVKGRREFRPLEWVRQLRTREQIADDLPGHVVMRPDGLGPAHIGDWLVIRPLAEDTDLLEELLRLRALTGWSFTGPEKRPDA